MNIRLVGALLLCLLGGLALWQGCGQDAPVVKAAAVGEMTTRPPEIAAITPEHQETASVVAPSPERGQPGGSMLAAELEAEQYPQPECKSIPQPFRFPCVLGRVTTLVPCDSSSTDSMQDQRITPSIRVTVSVCGKEMPFELDGRVGGARAEAAVNANHCLTACPAGETNTRRCRIEIDDVSVTTPGCPTGERGRANPSKNAVRWSLAFAPQEKVSAYSGQAPANAMQPAAGEPYWVWPQDNPQQAIGQGFQIAAWRENESGGKTTAETHLELAFDVTVVGPLPRTTSALAIPVNFVWVDDPNGFGEPLGDSEVDTLKSLLRGAAFRSARGSVQPQAISDLNAVFGPLGVSFTPKRLRYFSVNALRSSPNSPDQLARCMGNYVSQEVAEEYSLGREKVLSDLYAVVRGLLVPSTPRNDHCMFPNSERTLARFRHKHLNVYIVPKLRGFAAWAHTPTCWLNSNTGNGEDCYLPPSIFISRSAFIGSEPAEMRSLLARLLGHEILHLSGISHRKPSVGCLGIKDCEGSASLAAVYDQGVSFTCPIPSFQEVLASSITTTEASRREDFRFLDGSLACSTGASVDARVAGLFLARQRESFNDPTEFLQYHTTKYGFSCKNGPGQIVLVRRWFSEASEGNTRCAEFLDDSSGPAKFATCHEQYLFNEPLLAEYVKSMKRFVVSVSSNISVPAVRPVTDVDGRLSVPVLSFETDRKNNWAIILCADGVEPMLSKLGHDAVMGYQPTGSEPTLHDLSKTAVEFGDDWVNIVPHQGNATYWYRNPGHLKDFFGHKVCGLFRH